MDNRENRRLRQLNASTRIFTYVCPVLHVQGNRMIVPTEALAQQIAMEWEIQEKFIKPNTMHMVGLIYNQDADEMKINHYMNDLKMPFFLCTTHRLQW